MKMNKRGFTLIELLAVIVILAIIALIATPLILNVIDEAKKGAFKNSAYGIIEAAELSYALDMLNGDLEEITITYDNYTEHNPSGKKLQYKGQQPKDGEIRINKDGKIAIAISDGKYCARKGLNKSEVIITEESTDECKISISAHPELDYGMIPIYWDKDNVVRKADERNVSVEHMWYDYDEQMWANAVLVKETGVKTRDYYKSAQLGTEIEEDDILAYLVWIPRYKYKLFNVDSEEIEEEQIKIIFEDKNTPKSNGDENGEWLTHPAFTFGDDETNGFWVGKFETTGTIDKPTVKPTTEEQNVSSLRGQPISEQFMTAKLFNSRTEELDYGLTPNYDAHMMKNIEWGAVAYLSQSQYGKEGEIWINPSRDYYTGCAGDTPDSEKTYGCLHYYYDDIGMNASTTGNIYGIYDMSGGAIDYVMGGMYSSSSHRRVEPSATNFSEEELTLDHEDFIGLKYIDLYDYGESDKVHDYSRRHLGDATGETNDWYNDRHSFVREGDFWFNRGGDYADIHNSGIFAFTCNGGHGDSNYTFRLVVSGFILNN